MRSEANDCKIVAIVPAAGRSLRMAGQHKLLMRWRDSSTVMNEVLQAWSASQVTHISVVVRADDHELQSLCRQWPNIELIIPQVAPPDMKASIRLGLECFATSYQTGQFDRWMVAPADLPTLDSGVINAVIQRAQASREIVIPRFGGRHGHPVSLPWKLAARVGELSEHQGLDRLVADNCVDYLDLPAHQRPEDIDTPEDYARLVEKHRDERL